MFGVHDLLGSAMLLTGCAGTAAEKDPARRRAGGFGGAVCTDLSSGRALARLRRAAPCVAGCMVRELLYSVFRLSALDFYSTDYFALLPWLFLFWAGYFLHFCMGRQRMEPLRRSVCPALGWMGRHSLLLYLLHQPVIYGVLSAAAVLLHKRLDTAGKLWYSIGG